jgi:predicted PurR-regulated permease PerM
MDSSRLWQIATPDHITISAAVSTTSICRKRRPIMKNLRKTRAIGTALAIFFILCTVVPAIAGAVTLIGEVNDNYQLVSNGQIYEIADTPKGNELAENFISAKVKVTGSVEESNDMKILTVTAFEVIPE